MPLFWLCLAIIIGIFTASFFLLPFYIWASAAFICLVLGLFEYFHFRNRNHPLLSHPIFRIPFALILCAFFIGGMRFQSALPVLSPDKLLWYVSDKPVLITGVVKSDPYRANNLHLLLSKAKRLKLAERK